MIEDSEHNLALPEYINSRLKNLNTPGFSYILKNALDSDSQLLFAGKRTNIELVEILNHRSLDDAREGCRFLVQQEMNELIRISDFHTPKAELNAAMSLLRMYQNMGSGAYERDTQLMSLGREMSGAYHEYIAKNLMRDGNRWIGKAMHELAAWIWKSRSRWG